MGKGIRSIASIALPIAGSIFGGPIGGAIGGALGGALGGGGLTGAALGAITGYAGAGTVNNVVGNAAGSTLAEVTGNAALQGPTFGSGISGAVTGGGLRALGQGATQIASGFGSPSSLLGITNQLVASDAADTARKAAQAQTNSLNTAIAEQRPYTELGQKAINQINTIQADPGAYIQNNPFYKSLAADAERRLLANQAAKGKVGSGGTAAALQNQLMSLGNGLVQQQIGTLQQQAGIGQNATGVTSNLYNAQGDVNAAGIVGRNNALAQGYQNQLNTMLALQNLGRTPTYQPTAIANV